MIINYVLQLSPVPIPGQMSISVIHITATSISLSWSVPSGSVVTSSEVMWRDLSSGGSTAMTEDDGAGSSSGDGTTVTVIDTEKSGTSGSVTGTSYTIENLESNRLDVSKLE